ncbi:MAG: hypothetical protein MUC87_12055 [Bacteroidia bacterium]|jgi:hypothetical protein|nr:hypothetical protein [Bacteroidia bacterium]
MSSSKGVFRLERVRSFGGVFSDTKRILRENLGAFLGVLVLIIGPVVLITTTLNVYYINYLFEGKEFWEYENFGSYFGIRSLMGQTRTLFNGLFAAWVISHFLKVCREKGSAKFTVADVSRSIRQDFFVGLGHFLLLFVLCAALGISIVAILFWISSTSVAMAGLIIFFSAIGYMLLRFPFWNYVFSVFMARGSTLLPGADAQRPALFESFRLAGSVMVGQWWRTWSIMFCMWALLMVVGYLITVTSSFGTQILDMFGLNTSFDELTQKLIDTLLEVLSNFARTLVNCVFCVAVGLHYYSIKEFRYGNTISEQLNKIGKSGTNDDVELSY